MPLNRLGVYDELRTIHRTVNALLNKVDADDPILFHAVQTLVDVFYLAEGVAANVDGEKQ